MDNRLGSKYASNFSIIPFSLSLLKTQNIFKLLKSAIETLKRVRNMFKVNKKDTKGNANEHFVLLFL